MSDSANPVVGRRYGLGLQPHTEDPRDLQLADYWDFTTASSSPYRTSEVARRSYGHTDLIKPGSLGMLLNDRIGCCFVSDTMHALQVLGWTGDHDPQFDDDAAAKSYAELSGWNGRDEGTGTDVGCEPREGLKHFHRVGLWRTGLEDRARIGAYLWLTPRDPEQLEGAVKEFGVAGVAYDLTQNAEDEADDGRWRYVPSSPKIGGHWIAVSGGEEDGAFDTLTWGMVVEAERRYYEECSEAAAVWLSHAQLNGEGKTPEGLDFEKLQHDLGALRA